MIQIVGSPRHYRWGSWTAIPNFLRQEPGDGRLAELWFGAHPLGSSTTREGERLVDLIVQEPDDFLGPSTRYTFGDELPYLMKLIAPAAPLSLQVHPNKPQAQKGYQAAINQQAPADHPKRVYRDWNHKPELIYAIEPFEALVGFSVRRQIRSLLEGLDTPLATRLGRRLKLAAGRGTRPVVTWLLGSDDGPSPEEVIEFAEAVADRLESGKSPVPLLDKFIGTLNREFPGDPGIIVSFLMNPVSLQPGEALFIPPGTLHSYQSGLGLELMANSDNVIRAGLTDKHLDRPQLLEVGNFEAHPPVRVAPERPSPGTERFFAPVEDFLLTVVTLNGQSVPVNGTGPREVICLSGTPTLTTRYGTKTFQRGDCVFVTDREGPALAGGTGVLAQCSVP